jgi:hypothetical protein
LFFDARLLKYQGVEALRNESRGGK